MKALSIRQPWAWLIVTGHKDIENRTWTTSFRGAFLIHTGKTFDHGGYDWVLSEMGLALPKPVEFERGGIVGEAEMIDCVTRHNSPWFSGPYGFVLKGARRRQFVPMNGKLGFFDVEVESD
ncbi:MAG: ASCH domain-containing protein [Acidobacteriota bacterium]